MADKKIKVIPSDPPESTEILAANIKKISDAFNKLTAGGLNEKAIIALIHDDTKLTKSVIQQVVNSIKSLTWRYCKT